MGGTAAVQPTFVAANRRHIAHHHTAFSALPRAALGPLFYFRCNETLPLYVGPPEPFYDPRRVTLPIRKYFRSAVPRSQPMNPFPPKTPATLADERLTREAVRIYERYAIEVVERFELCPWAAKARREGAVHPQVLLQDAPQDLDPSLHAIDTLARSPSVSIALFIYPRLNLSRLDFEHFLRRLRATDTERHAPGQVPFAMAAFHPEAQADLGDADRLVPFIRKTPDPTLQLVRGELLDESKLHATNGTAFVDSWMMTPQGLEREIGPSVRDRIGMKNLETVRQLGAATLQAVFSDIARDRAESYASLLTPLPVCKREGPGRPDE